MKAMLFAAGLGTRLRPFTNTNPKALVEVNGISLLERNICYLQSYGIKDIIINVHHFADQIVDFLERKSNFGCNIFISDEKNEVLETGGGLLKAKKMLGESPFLVMNVDILTDLNLHTLIEFHSKYNPLVSLAVSERISSRKLFFTEKSRLVGWKNYSTEECNFVNNYSEINAIPLAFSGIHIIDPEIFSHISYTGKFSIMKVYMELMHNFSILGFKHSSKLVDVGRPESIKEAELYFE